MLQVVTVKGTASFSLLNGSGAHADLDRLRDIARNDFNKNLAKLTSQHNGKTYRIISITEGISHSGFDKQQIMEAYVEVSSN